MLCSLNGEILQAEHARISPFDRGFLFGDGVYEGLRAARGRIVAADLHNTRLAASLAEARIEGFNPADCTRICDDLICASGCGEAFIYLQVTRGAPSAGQPWRERLPSGQMAPTVFAYLEPLPPLHEMREPKTLTVSLRADTRWTRCHVKSISLMGNIIAALEAHEAGASDAIFIRDGLVSEGTSTNVFLSLNGRTITPDLRSCPMLEGVTRRLLLDADPTIDERPVRAEELLAAEEVMLVGTRTIVASISAIDGRPTRDGGRPGPAARRLLATLLDAIAREGESRHVA